MRATLILSLVLMLLLGYWFWPQQKPAQSVLIVGAVSGALAGRDQPMLTRLQDGLRQRALQEGIALQLHIVDSQSPAADLVERVSQVLEQGIHTVMGCGDSSCVRTLLPLLQQYDAILLYPGSSEGLMDSQRLVSLGPVANQYLFPAVSWVRHNLGQRLMFIGSESARSHMLHRLMQDQLLVSGGLELVSSEFVQQSSELGGLLDKVRDYKPDVILFDACEWYDDGVFIKGLAQSGPRFFSLCADQLPPAGTGLYYISSYFDNEHNQENRRLRQQAGPLSPLTVNAELIIAMWGDALAQGQLADLSLWQDYLGSHNDLTASGPVMIDQHFQGSWRGMYIVQQAKDGQQKLLWLSDSMLRPVMYPGLESPSDWKHHLTIFWRNAGGQWRTAVLSGEGA